MQFVGKVLTSVSEFYKDINPSTLSGAIDIVVIKHINNINDKKEEVLVCSPFHVRFGKIHVLRPQDKLVEISVNNNKIEDLAMKVGEAGEAFFVVPVNPEDEVNSKWITSPLPVPIASPEKEPSELDLKKSPLSISTETTSSSVIGNKEDIIIQQQEEFSSQAISDSELSLTRTSMRPKSPEWKWEWGGLPEKKRRTKISLSEYLADNIANNSIILKESCKMLVIPENIDPNILVDEATNLDNLFKECTFEEFAKTPLEKVYIQFITTDYKSVILPGITAIQNAISIQFFGRPIEKNIKKEESMLQTAVPLASNPTIETSPPPNSSSWRQLFGFSSSSSSSKKETVAAAAPLSSSPSGLSNSINIANTIVASNTPNITTSDGGGEESANGNGFPLEETTFSPFAPKANLASPSSSPSLLSAATITSSSNSNLFPSSNPEVTVALGGGGNNKVALTQQQSEKKYIKSLRLSSDELKKLSLKEGMNTITFSLSGSKATTVQSRVFLWSQDDKIVISDIDGTITKSDALGHLFTFVGKDWTHIGVARLFSDISRNGYKFLYLTSRAIGQANATRGYLRGIEQNKFQLPEGPVIMSPERFFAAVRRELIEGTPEHFKIPCLQDIRNLFKPPWNLSLSKKILVFPFYAGFGNRTTDSRSYRAVGVPPTRVFTINSSGDVNLELLCSYTSSYVRLTDLVDQMFPPFQPSSMSEKKEGGGDSRGEDAFNDFFYWKRNNSLGMMNILSSNKKKLANRKKKIGERGGGDNWSINSQESKESLSLNSKDMIDYSSVSDMIDRMEIDDNDGDDNDNLLDGYDVDEASSLSTDALTDNSSSNENIIRRTFI